MAIGLLQNKKLVSLHKLSKIAGLLYIFVIAGGLFAEIFVRQKLIVSNDPISTANNILSNEMLYRCGIVVTLFYLMCNVLLIGIYRVLFEKKRKKWIPILIFFFLIGHTIEMVNLVNLISPLNLLHSASNLDGMEKETANLMAYLSLEDFGTGLAIALVFFGAYCLIVGHILKSFSGFASSLAYLMQLAGICYIANTFCLLLFPDFAGHLFPFILLPCLIGETCFALWLLFNRQFHTIKPPRELSMSI